MNEADWLSSTDLEGMLNYLWDLNPEMQWTDRKLLLLEYACCKPFLPGLPKNWVEFFTLLEQSADKPSLRERANEYFEELENEETDEEIDDDFSTFIFAIGYNDLALAGHCGVAVAYGKGADEKTLEEARQQHSRYEAQCVRDLFGNPFKSKSVESNWLTSRVTSLASAIYEGRDFRQMPDLANVLREAGCNDEQILEHCRSGGEHFRGCWVLDLLLKKP